MDIRNTRLNPDTYFHIFNRGINGDKVFFEEKSYSYFLKQYAKYVNPFVDTFAYCLLSNHFHFLIRVRSAEELDTAVKKNLDKPHCWHVSNGFSSWLQSYTRAVNKMYNRTGSLFESPFKRIQVVDDAHFTQLISYIHQNPQKHGLVKDYREYPHSSYHAHLLEYKSSKLRRAEVLEWFGGNGGYIRFHQEQQKGLEELMNESWFME
ncbi:MAG: hypothetical protein AAFN93_05350 [Bacteroidota bacterium]